jgi:hypothetical protein
VAIFPIAGSKFGPSAPGYQERLASRFGRSTPENYEKYFKPQPQNQSKQFHLCRHSTPSTNSDLNVRIPSIEVVITLQSVCSCSPAIAYDKESSGVFLLLCSPRRFKSCKGSSHSRRLPQRKESFPRSIQKVRTTIIVTISH